MKTVDYKKQWRQRAQKDHDSLAEILSWDDLFDEGWSRDRMPEAAAADELHHALNLLYGQVDRAMALRFLKRAVDIVQRCVEEQKFENRLCKPNFPKNRGLANRVRIYARALTGEALDTNALRAAAEDIVEYYADWEDARDSQMQAYWLAAVRMMLIGGDPLRAAECVGQATSLEWHRQEADLLGDIAAAASSSSSGRITDAKLMTRLDRLFDKVRSPGWQGPSSIFNEPDELRWEVGLIRHRYFISTHGDIKVESVINAIRG